jgi:hypothetical protein
MIQYQIRFNKSRGMPGRGSLDHVWRVFENGRELLFKNLIIDVPSRGEKSPNSEDWNIVCEGRLIIDRNTSTAHIVADPEWQSP